MARAGSLHVSINLMSSEFLLHRYKIALEFYCNLPVAWVAKKIAVNNLEGGKLL